MFKILGGRHGHYPVSLLHHFSTSTLSAAFFLLFHFAVPIPNIKPQTCVVTENSISQYVSRGMIAGGKNFKKLLVRWFWLADGDPPSDQEELVKPSLFKAYQTAFSIFQHPWMGTLAPACPSPN